MSSVSLSGQTYKFLKINIKQSFGYGPTIACAFENLEKIEDELQGNDEIPIFSVFH